MKPFAVFWDQSLLWGLFVYDTLLRLQIPFDLLNAQAVRSGDLKNYAVLIVPGGWASHKKAALGLDGENAIRRFVYSGGGYIGFCGGAGLALSGENTLNMVKIRRLPLKKRLPSASGTVYLRLFADHPVSREFPNTVRTSVWWPSQFDTETAEEIHPMAFYEATGEDFWVSDIPAEGIDTDKLQKLESLYGINLDPGKCFLGHPAIIESCYGSGRLILSYPHLETPEDEQGNELFRRLLVYLEEQVRKPLRGPKSFHVEIRLPSSDHCLAVKRMIDKVRDFVRLGESHLLWFWRKPWMLGWRRGVRGLEYSMLMLSLSFLGASLIEVSGRSIGQGDVRWSSRMANLESLIDDFLCHAKRLLILERLGLLDSSFSKTERMNDSEADRIRSYLFGSQMSHGGLCRKIFDILDSLLFDAIALLQHYKIPMRLQTATTML